MRVLIEEKHEFMHAFIPSFNHICVVHTVGILGAGICCLQTVLS